MIRRPPSSTLFPSPPLFRSLYAFEHARPGDIFVQKAPATTVGDLAQALRELLNRNNEIKIIGTRHGEKLYERSEEHTSELQSPCNLVCRLLLEKKKKTYNITFLSLTISYDHLYIPLL